MRARPVRVIRVTAFAWVVSAMTVALATAPAQAQSLDLTGGGGSAAAVGRAGAVTVAGDDAAALWVNPAGLARRGSSRAQVGMVLRDPSASFTTAEQFGPNAAVAREQGRATRAPFLGLALPLGDDFVLGAAYLEPVDLALGWPAPPPQLPQSADDRAAYPGRYAGTSTALSRRALVVGAAWRAQPWLAFGASASAARVDLRSARMVFGGLGADALANLSPALDMPFSVAGHDWFVPGASVGAIVAPPEAPVEIGLAAAWRGAARLRGEPRLGDSRGQTPGGEPNVAAVVDGDAEASLSLAQAWSFRAGVRFLLPRASLEVDGELVHAVAREPVWSVEGVSLAFTSGPTGPLGEVPLGVRVGGGTALRAAADVDVTPGFLVLSAGWAWTRGGGAREGSESTALPFGDGHMVAGGALIYAGGMTFTVGVAHAFAGGEREVAPGTSMVIAPLAGGDALPAGAGRYRAADTQVSIAAELEW